MIQEEISGTLGCGNDQTIFCIEPKAFRIGAYYSAGMLSDNQKAGIIQVDMACTIDCNGGAPTSQQGGICIVQTEAFHLTQDPISSKEVSPCISAGSTHGQACVGVICLATQQGGAEIAIDMCPTITQAAGTSGNNQPVVCLLNDQGGGY